MRNPTIPLQILIGAVAACALLSAPAMAQEPFTVVTEDDPFDIAVGPYLQAPSPTSMTVIWLMNKRDSLGWVEYGKGDDLDMKATSAQDGLIDADDHVHKITLENLEPGTKYTYRVAAKAITQFSAYSVKFGETKHSATHTFTTPRDGQKRVAFLVFNDIHQNIPLFQRLHTLVRDDPYDLVLLNGDVVGHMDNEMQLVRRAIEPFAEMFAAETPYVYVRGNHDGRGRFARQLHEYVASPNGEFYHAFSYGPVRFLIMDLGEDKPDDHAEYGGLVKFRPYREAQRAWLAEEIETEAFQTAPFRVLVTHIPLLGDRFTQAECFELWGDLLKKAEIDLHLAAHTHRYATLRKAPDPLNCPVVIGGGSKAGSATVMRCEATRKELRLVMTRDDGEEVKEISLKTKR
ncbi:MAG: metallophosphoesterase [bacterium]|nr:metallophosphoesterase [bacterium]